MSSVSAFCFFPSQPLPVLFSRLENIWGKGLPYRFIYLENAQNPQENYSSGVAPAEETSALVNLVQEISETAIQEIVRDPRIASQPVIAAVAEGEAPGPGWICKIGDYYAADQDLSDFLAAAQVLYDGSRGRMIYLRDSYSLAKEIWTAPLERMEWRGIAAFPPNPNARECFEIIRVV